MIKELKILIFGHPTYNFPYSVRKMQFRSQMRRKWNKFKRSLYAPICFILGHDEWKDSNWNYTRMRCSRCNYMKSIWESPRNVSNK